MTTTDPDTDLDVDGLLAEILLTPEGKADPYPRFAAIREAGRAFRSSLGMVVVGRYEDCQQVLRNPDFGAGEPGPRWEQYGLTEDEWLARFPEGGRRKSLLDLDPPDHTRLRKLVAKAFTPRTVERLRPAIERMTDDLLDRIDADLAAVARGDADAVVDIVPALALQLPMTVIGELLGVPEGDRVELQPHVRIAVKALELNLALDELEAANAAGAVITSRFDDLIAERKARPTDDLLSELVHVEEAGDQLSHDELLGIVLLLFGAGFETTTNLIGNGLLALLDHPDELARLRANPSLLRTAVDELLRFDSPVQLDGRAVLRPAHFLGFDLVPGDRLVTLLGAANRDPRLFADPDRLDVGRDDGPPLSFGGGIHYCLGAALARAEGEVVFGKLLDRYSSIEPGWGDERPRYRDSIVLRGLESLPVRLTPATAPAPAG